MKRFGELTEQQREDQAEAFVRWSARVGGDWEDRYAFWAGGKEFHPSDEAGIRRLVAEMMLAGGAYVLADPMDWFSVTPQEPAA